jgi:bifunctional non-homologous end joining protein LigD
VGPGTWEPIGDALNGMAVGKFVFRLHGEKLAGLWELAHIQAGRQARPMDAFQKTGCVGAPA